MGIIYVPSDTHGAKKSAGLGAEVPISGERQQRKLQPRFRLPSDRYRKLASGVQGMPVTDSQLVEVSVPLSPWHLS